MKFGNRHRRRGIAAEGALLSLAGWATLFGVALLRDGTHWPDANPARGMSAWEAWIDFATLAIVVQLFATQAWTMARRTRRRTWLGTSLIASSAVLSWVFLWSMAAQLNGWETGFWVRMLALRAPLIGTAVFAILMIGAIREGEETDPVVEAWNGKERRERERRQGWPPPVSPA